MRTARSSGMTNDRGGKRPGRDFAPVQLVILRPLSEGFLCSIKCPKVHHENTPDAGVLRPLARPLPYSGPRRDPPDSPRPGARVRHTFSGRFEVVQELGNADGALQRSSIRGPKRRSPEAPQARVWSTTRPSSASRTSSASARKVSHRNVCPDVRPGRRERDASSHGVCPGEDLKSVLRMMVR